MNNHSCLTRKWWDTFSIPNCCGLTIKQNNTKFTDRKYQVENRKENCCTEWTLSPFTIF